MHWRERLFTSGWGWRLYWGGFGVAVLGSWIATVGGVQKSYLLGTIGFSLWALGGITAIAQLILMKHPRDTNSSTSC